MVKVHINFSLGNYEGEISDYTKAIDINPNDVNAFMNRGSAMADLGYYQWAIDDYTQALRIKPEYIDAYLNLGNMKSYLGDKEGAIAEYNKAILIKSDYADAYNNRGNAKKDLGDYEGAIADYSKAISINPDDVIAFNNRGDTKSDLGDYEGAIADHNKAISINPDDVIAYINRGNVKNNIGDYEGAIADYITAIEFESSQAYLQYLQGLAANTRSRLGANYVSEGRWYEGLEQFQASLDYYRKTDNLERRADVLAQIAHVQFQLGNLDKARMLYRDALRLYVHLDKKEGIANCHLALGIMMLRLNYIEDAQQELETACNLFSKCGLSQRQAEAKEVLQVVSQFKSKQALKL